jgi:hypothetical protein
MDTGQFLLLLLFFLTIGHLVTLKLCSVRLDHRTAPVFICGWTLLGLALTAPVYGHLWVEGVEKFRAAPYLVALCALKGGLLYFLFVISQRLMQVSLSSRHYVTPLAIGLITFSNFLLGETMTAAQWVSCMGLSLLALAFVFRGHLSDMAREARLSYAQLVLLSAVLGVLDIFITRETNWYAGLVVSNLVLLAVTLVMIRGDRAILKSAFFSTAAAIAGAFYMVTELVKFYQLVSINPGPVVGTVQAMTKPVILVLSAWVWKERTVREQMVWGVLALIITLPLMWDFGKLFSD